MPKSILLLIASWLSIYVLIYEFSKIRKLYISKRDIFLLSAVSWGACLVTITEGLSILTKFSKKPLLVCWILVFLVSLFVSLFLRWKRYGSNLGIKEIWLSLISCFTFQKKRSIILVIIQGLLFFQVATLALVAFQYLPNNWDAMIYHLTRVVHWQQNHSVAHFATNIDRQIQMPPFAEFLLANLQILLNNDRYSNFVQWFAMIICIIGVSNIAEKLGATTIQQYIASLFCAFIPMGILQSTSTQNDYVLAACLICFVSFGVSLMCGHINRIWIIGMGLALGLSLLTKGTAYVFAFPFCILFGFYIIKSYKKSFLKEGLLIVFIALLINTGHFSRNISLYGSPIGPGEMYSNETLSVKGLAANTVRNVALNFAMDSQQPNLIGATSSVILSWLRLVYQSIGLSPTDPKYSIIDSPNVFNLKASYSQNLFYNENFAGNAVHTILIIIAMVAFILGFGALHNRIYIGLYITAVLGSLMFYSGYLKWQVWGSRLLLPLFAIWCPIIAMILFRSRKIVVLVIPIILAIYLLSWTFNNELHPISLTSQMERSRKVQISIDDPLYQQIADEIIASQCKNVGLVLRYDAWEYPFWILLQDQGFKGRIEHINVANVSKKYQDQSFTPCAIIVDSQEVINQPGYEKVIDSRIKLLLNKTLIKN